jgi:Gpi18-like mannosyltransferase
LKFRSALNRNWSAAVITILIGAAVVLLVSVVGLARNWSGRGAGKTNLIRNGDFESAEWSGIPAHWHPQTGDSSTILTWRRTTNGDSEISIECRDRSSGEWLQSVYLRRGWYRLTGEIRVENVEHGSGARLRVERLNKLSPVTAGLHGTSSWQKVSLDLKEIRWGETVAVWCYLGPDASGRAWFRRIRLEPIADPVGSSQPLVGRTDSVNSTASERPGPDASNAVGVGCALVLAGLLVWAIYNLWATDLKAPDSQLIVALAIVTAILSLELMVAGAFDGYLFDARARFARAMLAVSRPLAQIYDVRWPDAYPPASIYPQWFSGVVARALKPGVYGVLVLMKAPTLLCNFALAIVLFLWAREWMSGRRAFVVMLLYALNPAAIFDALVWGQSDSQYTLLMVLSVVLFLRKQMIPGWALAALAVLVKPQAAPLIPVLGIYTLLETEPAQWFADLGAIAAVTAVTFLPFQVGHPAGWLWHVYRDLVGRDPLASVSAFNLHALFGGWKVNDTIGIGGITYFSTGMCLVLLTYVLAAWIIWRDRGRQGMLLAILITTLGTFLFAPRMHERYEYAALVFFAPLALETAWFTFGFALLSADYLANLVYVMVADETLRFQPGRDWIVMGGALVNLAIFVAVVAYAIRSTKNRAR